MHDVMQDLRYAMRGLRNKPLFAAVAVLSIAIGVGANASIFSIINRLLLTPPAGIGNPSQVIEIGRSTRGQGFDTFSYPELEDIARVPSVRDVSGVRNMDMSFTTPSGAGTRVFANAVSQPYFDAMGTTPQRGRFFTKEEDTGAETNVVVITDDFWKKHLAGRADVVGATIELDRKPFTVIGVTQPAFRGHVRLVHTDVFVPLRTFSGFQNGSDRRSSWLTIVARLAPGATVERASADLGTLFTNLTKQYPQEYDGAERSARAAQISGIPAAGQKIATAFLSLLMGMVVLVLLTTCANVAGMLLARAAGREREIAIRLAIGSGRARLVRQLLIESTVLFIAGGALGLWLSTYGLHALSAISLPVPVVLDLDFTPDMRVLAFGLALALITGLLFGLAPALQSTKPDLVGALRNEASSRHSRGGRMRRVFIIGQVMCSLVLLFAAGLFLRSLQKAGHIDAGFDGTNVRVLSFDLSLDGYNQPLGVAMLSRLTSTMESMPGVSAAAVASDLPLDMSSSGSQSYPENYDKDGFNTGFTNISPSYFAALKIPVIQGRPFTAQDAPTSQKVVVVSRLFAERVWPHQSAIGKHLRWGDPNGEERLVVGVVGDVKTQTLMEEPQPMLYLPIAQEYDPRVSLVVRSSLSATDAASTILRGTRAVDPKLALSPVQSLVALNNVSVLPQRMAAIISVTMGVLALILSGMGIYGVIAYMVTHRTREIGVRVAIGARREDVVMLVVRSAVLLAAPGLALGLAAAFAAGQLVRSFILGVAPLDPVTFIAVPCALLLMIAAATWVPARRASRITPMEALRSE